jgi:hypothetical protein
MVYITFKNESEKELSSISMEKLQSNIDSNNIENIEIEENEKYIKIIPSSITLASQLFNFDNELESYRDTLFDELKMIRALIDTKQINVITNLNQFKTAIEMISKYTLIDNDFKVVAGVKKDIFTLLRNKYDISDAAMEMIEDENKLIEYAVKKNDIKETKLGDFLICNT